MNKGNKNTLIKKFLPWVLGIIYVISPIDIIPDIIGGLGWLDDISVMGILFWWYYHIRPLRQKSKEGTDAGKEDSHKEEKRSDKHEKAEIETDPYKILGIEPNSTSEEIKAAYAKQAAQYHPDKVQHLGKELQELAHKKFILIQDAYDAVKKK